MTKLIYFATAGYEDPSRATIPFMLAKGALEAEMEAEIILANDATLLIMDRVVWQINGFGLPPLKELLDHMLNNEIPIHVCGSCAKARGVTDEDLKGKNAKFVSPTDVAKIMASGDKVICL